MVKKVGKVSMFVRSFFSCNLMCCDILELFRIAEILKYFEDCGLGCSNPED